VQKYFHIVICLIFVACARVGSPTGGAKDEIPPKFLSANPTQLSKNIPVDLKSIKITFDELFLVQDQSKQIIISPPLNTFPVILPNVFPNRELLIKFKEPLKENTTYSINFGESIKDYNENNPLKDFTYVFSTGNFIDSLKIEGTISNFIPNDKQKNIIVSLYKSDSTLDYNKKPYYFTRANDSTKKFQFNYLKQDKYKIIAFNDENNNQIFDTNKEQIGFSKEIIDLTENKSINLKLSKVQPKFKNVKQQQDGYGKIIFRFQGTPEKVSIQPLEPKMKSFVVEHQPRVDSANFWFDPKVEFSENDKNPKLKFLVQSQEKKDTISLFYSTKQEAKLKVLDKSSELIPKKTVKLSFNYPLKEVNSSLISVKKDNKTIEFKTKINQEKTNQLELDFPIAYDSKYDIKLEPKAITDRFETFNDSLEINYKSRSEQDFGKLNLIIENPPKQKFFLELIDEKGEKVQEIYGNLTRYSFEYLTPGEYKFRILVDENENGFYDYSDFKNEIQAEKTYLYPTSVLVRAYWDISETWKLDINL
jgi:uncharacterized protein (DUF2141 family)